MADEIRDEVTGLGETRELSPAESEAAVREACEQAHRRVGVPRRNRIDLFTPAEAAIYAAVQAVEEAGAHPLLTDAVVLLQQAREKVADYVDGQAPS